MPGYTPNAAILLALSQKENQLKGALDAALLSSIVEVDAMAFTHPRREVPYLVHFFVYGLPRLQVTMNAVLSATAVSVNIKSMFCHKNGRFGPMVNFAPTGPACELADLFVGATYGPAGYGNDFGNGVFLQAKVDSISGGTSTDRQRELYLHASHFIYQEPSKYRDGYAPDDQRNPGRRKMPAGNSSGFCFWTFAPQQPNSGAGINAWWQASSVYTRNAMLDRDSPRRFADAVFEMFKGAFGEALGPFAKGKFEWNRIVHDVIRGSMQEVVGKNDIVSTAEIRRLLDGESVTLESVLNAGLAVKSNPFSFLSGFDSASMRKVLDEFHGARELDKLTIIKRCSAEGVSPPKRPRLPTGGNLPGGGMPFIFFEFSSIE